MDISFGKTVYVAGVGDSMLDAIENYNGINPTMTGDKLVMYEYDELEAAIEDIATDDGLEEVEKYLLQVITKIREIETNPLGDIVFTS